MKVKIDRMADKQVAYLKQKNLYSKIFHVFEKNQNFIILTHVFPDGDAVGSMISLYELLIQCNKNVSLICNSELPYQYKFLPSYNLIKSRLPFDENNKKFEKKYVSICVDCADEKRMDLDFDLILKNSHTVINIDHHNGNNNFGHINLVDKYSAATCEIIYELILSKFKNYLNYNIALGIYVGILTDTGRFQYSNTTYNIHKIAGELIKLGVSPPEIYGYVYENDPLNRFKLVQIVFSRIKFYESLGLIYSYILQRDFRELNLPFYAQDGIIELLRSAKGARIKVLIKQIGKLSYKISLRTSDKNINLSELVKKYGGGGHRTAAAYSDEGSLKEVTGNLVRIIKNDL